MWSYHIASKNRDQVQTPDIGRGSKKQHQKPLEYIRTQLNLPRSAEVNLSQEFYNTGDKGADTDPTVSEFSASEHDSTARIRPQLWFRHISQTSAQRATLRGGIRGKVHFEAVEQPAALLCLNIHKEISSSQSAIPVKCPSTVHWDVLPFNFFAVKSHWIISMT